jgi:hypothetical protein
MANLPVLVDQNNVPRVLAALPPRPWQPIPRLAATAVVLPRSQWQEIDLAETYRPPILDQKSTSSCVGHGAGTAATVAWAQRGYGVVRLSSCFIYAQINGDRDQGAVVSDAAVELTRTGTCLESECPEGMIYRRQIPASAYQSAARYRLARSHHAPSFDEIGTALTLGMPVVGGFLLGNNFMNPGADALTPVPDRVIGGHALALLGLVNRGGRWLLKFQNSWGDWGPLHGFGLMTEEFVGYTAEVTRRQWGADLDAFALESVVPSPDDAQPVAPAP